MIELIICAAIAAIGWPLTAWWIRRLDDRDAAAWFAVQFIPIAGTITDTTRHPGDQGRPEFAPVLSLAQKLEQARTRLDGAA